ncbi:MAG: DNA-3-methyladenine glycosylase I, partial [Cyanobacteria bacterium P01_D01_bin.73]
MDHTESKRLSRCDWAGDNPLEISYHDNEWGQPVHDDRLLFEFLILEGAQAGLSWSTILKKREGYRRLFHNFEVVKVAKMTDADQARLLQDPSIVRNRLKVASAIKNAKVVLSIQQEFGTLDNYFWSYVEHQPIV